MKELNYNCESYTGESKSEDLADFNVSRTSVEFSQAGHTGRNFTRHLRDFSFHWISAKKMLQKTTTMTGCLLDTRTMVRALVSVISKPCHWNPKFQSFEWLILDCSSLSSIMLSNYYKLGLDSTTREQFTLAAPRWRGVQRSENMINRWKKTPRSA